MLIASCLPSCAGSDTLPQIGQALLKARDFYIGVDRAQGQLEHVADLVCKEPAPELVNTCAEVAQGLADADKANDVARAALLVASSLYNVVGGADDADAGAP